jgi:hypothetical protein
MSKFDTAKGGYSEKAADCIKYRLRSVLGNFISQNQALGFRKPTPDPPELFGVKSPIYIRVASPLVRQSFPASNFLFLQRISEG